MLVLCILMSLIGCGAKSEDAQPTINIDMATLPIETEETEPARTEDNIVESAESDVYVPLFDTAGELPARTTDLSVGQVLTNVINRFETSDGFSLRYLINRVQDGKVWATSESRLSFNNRSGDLYSYSQAQYEGNNIINENYVIKEPSEKYKYVTYSFRTEEGPDAAEPVYEACYGRSPLIDYQLYELFGMFSYLDIYQDNYDIDGRPHYVLVNFMPIDASVDLSFVMYVDAEDFTVAKIEQLDIEGNTGETTFDYEPVEIIVPNKENIPVEDVYGSIVDSEVFNNIKEKIDTFDGFFNWSDYDRIRKDNVLLTFADTEYHLGDTLKDVAETLPEGYTLSAVEYISDSVTFEAFMTQAVVEPGQVMRLDVVEDVLQMSNCCFWVYNPGETEITAAECIIGGVHYHEYYLWSDPYSVSMLTLFDIHALFGDNYNKSFSGDVAQYWWDNEDILIYGEDLGFMWNSIVIQDKNAPDIISIITGSENE